MKKFKKLIFILVALVSCLALSIGVSACGNDDGREDVAIIVGGSDGLEYEFPIGTYELHGNVSHGPLPRTYKVINYMFEKGSVWIDVSSAHHFFTVDILYGDGEKWIKPVDGVTDYGEYYIKIKTTPEAHTYMKNTTWNLYITVV